MPNIDYTRAEVTSQLQMWTKIADCLAGQQAVKDKGDIYLPRPNATDKSPENRARYEAYKLRATFVNATDNTLQGLMGQVFNADPVVELPDSMKPVELDATGDGVTLTQLARMGVHNAMAFGRCGLVVDFPDAQLDDAGKPVPFTRQQVQDGAARPTLTVYHPEQVINWRTQVKGGKRVYTLVVIRTQHIANDDGFALDYAPEWRVYQMVGDVFVLQFWRTMEQRDANGNVQFEMVRQVIPTGYDGRPLGFIPFMFVGSLYNNEFPDKPPLYDLAEVNLAHYRNSADYEETLYMTGQFTPVATGLSERWVEEVWKGKELQLGSLAVIPLPKDGDFKLVAAEAGSALKEALDKKEQQMAMLGARLVEQRAVQRTLGEAQMERAQVECVLVQCAKNTGAAVQQGLRWASLFYGPQDDTIVFELSTDFAIQRLTPEDRRQLLAEYQGGLLAFEEARNNLRQSGVAYLDDAEAKTSIDQEAEAAMSRAIAEATALAGTADEGDADGGNSDE